MISQPQPGVDTTGITPQGPVHFVGTVRHAGPSLSAKTDYLAYFNLKSAYDRHVRPFMPDYQGSAPAKILEPSYLPYIADVSGNRTITKDEHKTLFHILCQPPRGDPVPISVLDHDVIDSAFALRPGDIPGFDKTELFGALDVSRLEDTQPGAQPSDSNRGTDRPTQPKVPEKFIIKLNAPTGPPLDGGHEDSSEKKKKKKKKKREHHDGDGDDADGGEKKHKKKKKKHKEGHSSHHVDEAAPTDVEGESKTVASG
ncbi:uncharacterized protein BJ171DRAFT_91826 [Polychytrium aggregatum]|uniref:uncharacterized protein n=1 Tax=Polychytrium aggregatum TaxID=110093 RepID=UPI0022FEE1D1|nr:uncharacterized protein BJ171DRAFT_91826 [Polychytrium aggregatum]KAI9204926.1 hypothetical protein BJ171DRAFT_91826 [Polychytrium aggregatum]